MHSKSARISIKTIGKELESLKLNFVRRNGNPDEIICSVPALVNHHAPNIDVSGLIGDVSQIREIGEFAVNASYLLARACEMRSTAYECHLNINFTPHGNPGNISSQEDVLSFIDPTSIEADKHEPPHVSRSVDRTGRFFQPRVTFNPQIPQVILSPQACHSILSVTQLYLSVLSESEIKSHAFSGHLRLQHLNGILKTLQLLRSYHRYAFFNPVDLRSVDEAILKCREIIKSFIRNHKFETRRESRGSGKSSSALLVPSNALINSFEVLCETAEIGNGITECMSFCSNPFTSRFEESLPGENTLTHAEMMKCLLPIRSREFLERNRLRDTEEITDILKEMCSLEFQETIRSKRHGHETLFNIRDASSLISSFSKVGVVDRDLISICLDIIAKSSSETSPTSAANVLFCCGSLGMSIHDSDALPRIASAFSAFERMEPKLLRMISMSGAMLGGFHAKKSAVGTTLLERWWKRVACNVSADTPFCVLVDIGHSMKAMGIESGKANYLLAEKLENSDKSLNRCGRGGASILETEPLATLIKGAYMFYDTQFDRGEREWKAYVDKMADKVTFIAQKQVESHSVVYSSCVVGGFSTEPRVPLRAEHNRGELREHEVLSNQLGYIVKRFAQHLASSRLENETKSLSASDTSSHAAPDRVNKRKDDDALDDVLRLAFDEPSLAHLDDENKHSDSNIENNSHANELQSSHDSRSTQKFVESDSPSSDTQDNAVPSESEHNQSNPHIVSLGNLDPLPNSPLDENAQFLIATQWSVLSRAEVIEKLASIDPDKLDEPSVFSLIHRIADNVDGDSALQREVSQAMVPLFVALQRLCSNSVSSKRLFEYISLLDVIGEPLVVVNASSQALNAIIRALVQRIPDLTRTQASDLVGILESVVSLYCDHPDNHELEQSSGNLLDLLGRRFKGFCST